ncbi:MAG: transporter substrate-binding domain-containing protein, partial [Rhodobacteraceae bacterium]|nr:transporter substrate-binding domain-containing protein [Paracoccaceae bacterium]
MTRTLRAAIAAVALAASGPALALNICVEGAYPPFSETAVDGSIVGFDVDIANALCAEIGEECALVKVDW